jgi:hypothetical protein
LNGKRSVIEMKKMVTVLSAAAGLFVSLLAYSCASRSQEPPPEPKAYEKRLDSTDTILGQVEVTLESYNNDWDTIVHNTTRELAYAELTQEARRQYGPGTAVKNFTITMIAKPRGNQPPRFRANGLAVAADPPAGSQTAGVHLNVKGLEGATLRTSDELVAALPKNATLAVLSISSADPSAAEFVIDELEYRMVAAKAFKIVDRKTLDMIRSEQHFQLSGEVSDSTAVDIGKMLGASIVVTGGITAYQNMQRLTVKEALNNSDFR